jgi:hypothetical protein
MVFPPDEPLWLSYALFIRPKAVNLPSGILNIIKVAEPAFDLSQTASFF